MNIKLFKNKKGNFLAVLIIMVVIFIFALSVVFSKYIGDNFLVAFNQAANVSQEQLDIQSEFTAAYEIYDYAMIFMVGALIIGLMITSFLIPTHPVFMVINVVGIFVLVGFGMIMTNAYGDIMGEDVALGNTALQFEKMNYVVQYLPYFGAIAIFLATIIMYSRGTNIGGGGY